MEAGRCDLILTRGDDYTNTFTFVDVARNPLNLSGLTYAAQLRANPDAFDSVSFTVNTAAAASGQISISLTALQTAALARTYVWDMQQTNAGNITTLLAGSVAIAPDVTR